MFTQRKVAIIGDGMVGSSIAYTLVTKSNVNSIIIIDINKDKTEGDALDMNHAMSLFAPKEIKSGSYEDIQDAGIIVITAGAAQKPGETRIDLLHKNEAILDSIFDQMKPYLDPRTIVLLVSNPVDVLSHYAYEKLGLPANQIIGSGTVLDTARLKYLLSLDTGIDPRNIHAYIVGEHGDSELAAYSVTYIAGVSISEFCRNCGKCNKSLNLENIEEEVVNSAYEIIKKKGSTYYGIAAATYRIIDSIVNDTRSVLTVSSHIEYAYNGEISDVYLSVPSIVGRSGVIRTIWPDYSEQEKSALIESANKLKNLY